MYCSRCGAQVGAGAMSCHRCEAPIQRAGGPQPAVAAVPVGYARAEYYDDVSSKSRLVMLLLCWFLGVFGVHRFYARRIGTGFLWLLTLGFIGCGVVFDLILIICGVFRDDDGRRIVRWVE